MCQIVKGTQFQNLTLKCCFLTWRRACHSYSGYMYRAAQLITTGKYFSFSKGTHSLDLACPLVFVFVFVFTWNLPPLPLAQTKMLPSPRLPLLAPSSVHSRWKNQLIVAAISVCMSSVPFIVPDSRLWS